MYSESGSSHPAGSTRIASTGDTVLVALLGEIAVRRDGVLAPVPGARARLLVAALASHPGRSRSAPALIDEIWGDQPPRAPMNALHTQVSRLRSALPEGALEIGPAGYRLVLAADQVDLTLATALKQQARQAYAAGDVDTALRLVARTRALWRGEPGADLPGGPVADELAALTETRAQALDALELSVREDTGDLTGALGIARRAATARPLDETAHTDLMRLLAASGRSTDALDVFATLRSRLIDQLGADPGPTISAMNAAILRGEPLPGANGKRRATPDSARSRATEPGNGVGTDPDRAPLPGSVRGPGEPLRKVLTAQHATARSDHEMVAAEALSAIGLRAAPNPLLGRDADLIALEQSLRNSRVTTVLGPGGTGKTRVANELGARLAAERSVALVELASVRPDPADASGTRAEVEAAIAATLGIGEVAREANVLRPSRVRDTRQLLREALSSRPILLILDNCEHLIEAAAEVVADLVGITDQLTVLTTSRAPLEITAETVYPLPPLAIDAAGSPATDLFTARARAVRPSIRLDQRVVARLCETLDGLPLAIELAAARARTMSVEEIESRLDQRFALLRSGDRGSPQRHRTLYAVIDWSWNLLDEQQRMALRRLCRFPGGFTMSAAEALLDGPEVLDAATAVDGLVSQSLLTVLDTDNDPEWRGEYRTRYRMLETVREFGEEQLAISGEADLVRDRMLRWGTDFALNAIREYGDGDQIRVVLTLTVEADNLVAVLRSAIECRDAETANAVFPVLAFLWIVRGAHLELVSWVPRILAIPPAAPATTAAADLQVFGLVTVGLHMMYLGDGERGVARVRVRARRLLRSGTTPSPMLRYLAELAVLPPEVTPLARKLAEGVRSDETSIRSTALLVRANVYENAGDVHGSIRDILLAARLMRAGDVWGTALLSQQLGGMYGQSSRYGEAVEHYRRAAECMRRMRAYEESVEMSSYLAAALAGIGESAEARRELEPALRLLGIGQSVDAPVGQPSNRRAAVVAALAEIELAEGNTDIGLRRMRQVLHLLDWPNDSVSPGPGDMVWVAGVIDAHVLYGRAAEMSYTVGQLADIALRRLVQLWDVPQIGAVANAVGTYLLSVGERTDCGLELLALVPKVKARQDSPSMRWERHVALHRPVVGDERMDAALRSVTGLGRRRAGERVLRLLGDIAPGIH
ncbi:AAA family ATPase [Nocardia uniformis]|uniref:AAA family ATPase n=1 Tax=Nocardia uniformis TaxID=53432 RepID=A0A849CA37_9NOCA|nr:BTAD domain-containing putative transcriptional regulator [Nocardia uniformis]NNH75412.1 AAA family ATPase [Nocardia uniformis]